MTQLHDVLKAIRTKEERDHLVSELECIQQALYQVDEKKLEEVKKNQVRIKTVDALEKLMQTETITWKDTDMVNTLSKKLTEMLMTMKTLIVCIAFDPTEQTLQIIYDWAKDAVKEAVLIDIQIDRKMLGGATIVFEGLYRSWSLADKIEEYFAKRIERSPLRREASV